MAPSIGPWLSILVFLSQQTPCRGNLQQAQLTGHGQRTRQLDVAVLQHLIVEGICEPTFCNGGNVTWKFPHTLDEARQIVDADGFQLAVIMQPTPIGSIGDVCSSGELMPQKSTFFYPKLATGLAINPVG